MRLPRMPALSRPRQVIGDLITRPVFLYAAYTMALFGVFVIVTFPHDIVVRRALERVRNPSVEVNVTGTRFAWFNGYELQGVKLAALPLREGEPPLLEWARLRVRPDYAALLKGDTSTFIVSGELYGGTAAGVVNARPGALTANLQWTGLELRRYRALTALLDEGEVTGVVSGSWSISQTAGEQSLVQSSGEIVLARAGLTGAKIKGFKVSDLQLSEARAKATLHGGKLEFQEMVANGDDLSLQAGGNVTLKAPAAESLLNLRVSIQKVPDSYKPLLALLPRRGGKDTMPLALSVSGTLGSPAVR